MDIDGKLYCPRCMRTLAQEGDCPHCGFSAAEKPSASALDRGTLLNGRYQLGAVIGQGGFGITYAAWDEILAMPVAVKEYFPQDHATRNTALSDDVVPLDNFRAVYLDGMLRFQRESRLLAELQGIPEVVKVLDFFAENNTSYIAMEFVRGVAADRWVREHQLSPAETLRLMRPVFDALVATHRQGVLHRDLTPSNILVREDGTVKLIDFGSATETARSHGTVMLTRKYAPVEQYGTEHGAQGPWTDVYGVCAVLYTLLCGVEPQEAVLRVYGDELAPPAKHRVSLKRYQSAALMAGLAVRPDDRIQSMEELRSRLYGLPLPEAVRRHRRFVRRAGIAAAVLLAAAAVAAANFSVGLPLGQGLLWSLRGDGWHIRGETGHAAERSLPGSLLGVPVVRIDDGAFSGDDALETVSVPGSVREIGGSAFYDCGALEAVTLGEGVERVGTAAFAQCPRLAAVTAPRSLTAIAETAFFGAPEGASLVVPADSTAFAWAQEHGVGCVSGLEYALTADGAVILAVADTPGDIVLPSTLEGRPVTAIGDGVRLRKPSRVVLPAHLVRIPDGMFYLSDVVSVTIGGEVTEIGDHAFLTSALETVTIPDSVRVIGESAFCETANLRQVEVGRGVTAVGAGAFERSGIRTIRLPDTVTEIGAAAFADTPLESVTLGAGLTAIPDDCFARSALTTVALPPAVGSIGRSAFSGSGLEYIAIPEGVTAVGESAFANCADLLLVYAPGRGEAAVDGTAFGRVSRDMVIAANAGGAWEEAARSAGCRFSDVASWSAPAFFADGTAVYTAADMPRDTVVPMVDPETGLPVRGVTVDGSLDFCPVETIALPPFMTSVDEHGFFLLSNLRTVTAAGRITEVGGSALQGCTSLETFPFEHLEKIGEMAFAYCGSLREARLPDTVTEIGYGAFTEDTSLEALRLPDNPRLVHGTEIFVHVPVRDLVVPGSMPSAAPFVYGMDCLERLVCEEGVLSLDELDAYAMEDTSFYTFECPSLKELWLPSTVRAVGTVFGAELKDVWCYGDDTAFGEDSFQHCAGTVTVHAHPGSAAEAFAAAHALAFEPIPAGEAMPASETILRRAAP